LAAWVLTESGSPWRSTNGEDLTNAFAPSGGADGRPRLWQRQTSHRWWILNTGAQWHMLPQCYPNYNTVHRRFKQWCEREILRDILTHLANTLREDRVSNWKIDSHLGAGPDFAMYKYS
jgi:transposase